MDSDPRKAGPVICTEILTNFSLRKRGFEKLIHVIPVCPAFKTQAFTRPLASFLGWEFVVELQKRMGFTEQKKRPRRRAK